MLKKINIILLFLSICYLFLFNINVKAYSLLEERNNMYSNEYQLFANDFANENEEKNIQKESNTNNASNFYEIMYFIEMVDNFSCNTKVIGDLEIFLNESNILETKPTNLIEGTRVSLLPEDYECLLRIVEAEASTEGYKGKILVANVVLNRLETGWGDTVREVVFAKNQFAPIANGRYYKVEVTEETIKAVNEAINGVDYSKGAIYFMSRKYANPKNVKWFDENLTFLFKHKGHEFFKE